VRRTMENIGIAHVLNEYAALLARLYPMEGSLNAERQVGKLALTLVPKEVRNARRAWRPDAVDCTICAVVFQAGVGARPGAGGGALLAPGKRTVTAILHVMGLSEEAHFQNYHRVLNRAQW
jgi:hypothetical protein